MVDVKGLQTRIVLMEDDLKTTSEVAALTSDYLDKATQDYKRPEGVEYENIITPANSPEKMDDMGQLGNSESPLLGVAMNEC